MINKPEQSKIERHHRISLHTLRPSFTATQHVHKLYLVHPRGCRLFIRTDGGPKLLIEVQQLRAVVLGVVSVLVEEQLQSLKC